MYATDNNSYLYDLFIFLPSLPPGPALRPGLIPPAMGRIRPGLSVTPDPE